MTHKRNWKAKPAMANCLAFSYTALNKGIMLLRHHVAGKHTSKWILLGEPCETIQRLSGDPWLPELVLGGARSARLIRRDVF